LKGFERHATRWRRPAQIISHWEWAEPVDPSIVHARVAGEWWETVDSLGITLLVTRETEHLVLGLTVTDGEPDVTYVPIPHPSGLAVDRTRCQTHIASTRNPNQVFTFEPVIGEADRPEVGTAVMDGPILLPAKSRFLPGATYLHDLALVGGRLHANAVGQNAVVRIDGDVVDRVWWPKSIESDTGPLFHVNHLQLNSIAAGTSIADSFFSASAERPSVRRPGHLNFPVDRRGVIFSGRTREPVVSGLTRPHSARLHEGALWVDDSGYGTVGTCDERGFTVVASLPGWTRGLCFAGSVAFVGTSRVIPRYRAYAPGLDATPSICAIHAIDAQTGRVLGRIEWPAGNQIFAIDWIPRGEARGFAFRQGHRGRRRERNLFYAHRPAVGAHQSNQQMKERTG
jgi:uncharacterized protein (TIGR03032 family)